MIDSKQTRSQPKSRERVHTRVARVVPFLSLWVICVTVCSAHDPARWSVPVRVYTSDAAVKPPEMMPMAKMPAPAATALPPQYQTTRRTRAGGEPKSDDARFRFIVPLVERPIVVEATVMIDGKPFRMRREERIDKLLAELSQPERPAKTPTAAETPGAGATPPPTPTKADSPKRDVDNSITARLRRYGAAAKHTPARDEVRWLLTHWAEGPTLLWLDGDYQRVRANASPLFKILDRDEDGVLTAEEIQNAEKSAWAYDLNQDEVISLSEVNKGAERTPAHRSDAPSIAPYIPLDQLANVHTFQQLRDHYKSPLSQFDRDGDGTVVETELDQLRAAQPDLSFQVAFVSHDASRSRLELSAMSSSLGGDSKPIVRETSLTVSCGKTLLELSAVQSQSMPDVDQISFGAVRDGFPMLPEADVNEDGRLSVRELRQLSTCVAAFDVDKDGSVASAELPPTLRLSIGLGPVVHRHLATVRSVHRAVANPTVSLPEWFRRMDRNQDGDLTVREFLGAKEQFASLDTDQDKLISSAEAMAGEKQK